MRPVAERKVVRGDDFIFGELATLSDSGVVVCFVRLKVLCGHFVFWTVREPALKNMWWDEVASAPIHALLCWSA